MDFIVTAGNSFGLMDGGLDKAVADEFPGIELCVRDRISRVYGAQMPVGTAENFFWEKGKVRNIIYAPTMQVPMDINGTDNVYLATMAAVHTAVNRTGRVNRTIWMPMMGTGTGRMPLDAAMRQMARGVKDGLWKWKAEDMTWSHAQEMHERWHEMTGIPDMIPKTYGGDEQS
ncbi:MAG: macro domain-containing protein [Candidatus Ventricola sp.]